MKDPIFLFECNRTRDISQHLNGEAPYRLNLIDYYALNSKCENGYEHLMHINQTSDYAHTSKQVLLQKKQVANDLAKRNPGRPVIVLTMEVNETIPVMERIQEAIIQYVHRKICVRQIPEYIV
jgi:hypothetical protein